MPIKPDPATPAGEAIIDLADLMDGLQERTGEWPGADTVEILGGWLSRFSFAVDENLTPQVTGRAWVLRQWDRHSDDVTLWADEASALASLAQQVRSAWDDVAGEDGVPFRPPADDRAAVDLFYEVREGIEGYTLYPANISRHLLAPLSLRLSDDEACAEANSSAVFHPMDGPDDEGLPCMEIAGILVFAYLDAERPYGSPFIWTPPTSSWSGPTARSRCWWRSKTPRCSTTSPRRRPRRSRPGGRTASAVSPAAPRSPAAGSADRGVDPHPKDTII